MKVRDSFQEQTVIKSSSLPFSFSVGAALNGAINKYSTPMDNKCSDFPNQIRSETGGPKKLKIVASPGIKGEGPAIGVTRGSGAG